ncbi:MAG: polysaccharide biosynthesis/export family protein [Smithellaceae bacterium]|nr:polysaccharide biosynthesis/export family protein [Smithellaceae bacterium]
MTLNIFSQKRMVMDRMRDKAPESGPLDPIRDFRERIEAMASFLPHFFRKTCCHVVILTLTSLLFFTSCVHSPDVPSQFETDIKTAEDVDQLKRLETQLTVTPEKAALHPDYQVIDNIAIPYVPEYRMGPGDVLEIVYHLKYEKTEDDYRLEVQDRVSINFPFQPQYSSSVLVRSDGKITMPLIGDVAVESKTPMELATELNRQYKKYFVEPSITVALEAFNVKIDELKKAITTAARGQSKIAPISPDGRISFPVIGSMQVQGFTVAQVEKRINESYAKQVRNLNCTLILLEIHNPKLYVLGEVEKPGAYDIGSVPNVLNALTLAGGFKKSGELEEIAIFRNEGLERPIAFRVDIRRALRSGVSLANIKLKPGDIVYVPKTRLDEINDEIEKIFTKGIYAVLPFTTSLGASYSLGGTTLIK